MKVKDSSLTSVILELLIAILWGVSAQIFDDICSILEGLLDIGNPFDGIELEEVIELLRSLKNTQIPRKSQFSFRFSFLRPLRNLPRNGLDKTLMGNRNYSSLETNLNDLSSPPPRTMAYV